MSVCVSVCLSTPSGGVFFLASDHMIRSRPLTVFFFSFFFWPKSEPPPPEDPSALMLLALPNIYVVQYQFEIYCLHIYCHIFRRIQMCWNTSRKSKHIGRYLQMSRNIPGLPPPQHVYHCLHYVGGFRIFIVKLNQ